MSGTRHSQDIAGARWPTPAAHPAHPAGEAGAGPGPYRAPRWLPGGNAQTIYASLFTRVARPAVRRERWETPDGDFVDVDRIDGPAGAPLLVLFHGLEGGSPSHYARALLAAARDRGWRAALPHFRGCSGELNRLPRAYHSGDSDEIDWILRRLVAESGAPVYAAGVSLGGNALLKWLGERSAGAVAVVRAAAAVSAPVDLMAAGDALGRGFNMLYTKHFLVTMKRKGGSQARAFPRAVRRPARCARAHPARVRRSRDRAAARLPRHRRLLDAREHQALARAHPRADAHGQRPQRSVSPGGEPAARRRGLARR